MTSVFYIGIKQILTVKKSPDWGAGAKIIQGGMISLLCLENTITFCLS